VPAVSTSDPCDTSQIPLAQYNPDLARELVQEAGAEGLTFELWVTPGDMSPEMAQIIQSQLAEVGLNVEIVNSDLSTYIDEIFVQNPAAVDSAISYESTGGNPTLSYDTWAADWQNPYSSLSMDEAYLELAEQMAPMDAGPERSEIFQQMCELIYENASNLPLTTKGHLIAYRSDRIRARIQPVEVAVDFFKYASEYSIINPEKE
jgi:peptide/nickel transport system substrate-binding protein